MRIIHYINEDGSIEGVFFTDDNSMDSKDVCPQGCSVESDTNIDIDLPSSFPTEMNLEKSF